MMDYLAVFPPLMAFLIAGLFGKRLGDRAVELMTCAGILIAAAASVFLYFDVIIASDPRTLLIADWIAVGDFKVSWALRMDQLAVVMMCVVNIVSACVHVYSLGYMSHDPHRARFMAYLSLFTFAMLMLVTADNMLQLFFGWEGVGVASYLLIGFWNKKHSANAAAMKAFIVNRIGDFGLALGIMATFVVFGTIQFDGIFDRAAELSTVNFMFMGHQFHAMTLICLLLFIGSIGKSAQIGLHTWLPDAMEGPTPVSALIHAATMVTAGVFLLARLSPMFEYAPDIRVMITVAGTLTAFIAATIGMTQFDIKRVIAYSTMSQLGYMFFALGVSAYSAAIFHLMTHAFFKALLFLGAGSVIHSLSDEQDMRNMGGLWKKIPFTYGAMWIGGLALAGIPPLAGFYSKDVVMESAFMADTWNGTFAFWASLAAAFMTSFYTWRLIHMAFHGKPRASAEAMSHVHESPPVMLIPLLVLALGAVFSGWVLYEPFVGDYGKKNKTEIHAEMTHETEQAATHAPAEKSDPGNDLVARYEFWGDSILVLKENDSLAAAHHAPKWVKLSPLTAGLLGFFLAYLIYMAFPGTAQRISRKFSAIYRLFFNKWYFDEIYNAVFVKNAYRLGRFFWIGGDKKTIDGLGPDGMAGLSARIGGGFRRLQTGYVYHYAFVMMVGLVLLIGWLMMGGGG